MNTLGGIAVVVTAVVAAAPTLVLPPDRPFETVGNCSLRRLTCLRLRALVCSLRRLECLRQLAFCKQLSCHLSCTRRATGTGVADKEGGAVNATVAAGNATAPEAVAEAVAQCATTAVSAEAGLPTIQLQRYQKQQQRSKQQ